jgi:uncharacterized membrane protein
VSYEHGRAASFYDEFGEREWTRFEDGRTPWTSLDVSETHEGQLEKVKDSLTYRVAAGPATIGVSVAFDYTRFNLKKEETNTFVDFKYDYYGPRLYFMLSF